MEYKTPLQAQIHKLFLSGKTRMEISLETGAGYATVNRVLTKINKGDEPKRAEYVPATDEEMRIAVECIQSGISARQAFLAGKFEGRGLNSCQYLFSKARGTAQRQAPNQDIKTGGEGDLRAAIIRTERAFEESFEQVDKPFPMPRVSILETVDKEKVKQERVEALGKF